MSFEQSFQFLLQWEGGYTDNPHDAGGKTNLGVIQTEYDSYRRKKGLSTQSVAHITQAEAKEIYEFEYWDATRCVSLNPGVANVLFDSDVNSGNKRGVEWLQQAINSDGAKITVDGRIGPATIAAANAMSASYLIDQILKIRLAFLERARNSKTGELLWPTFGKGWSARIDGVRIQSHKLANLPTPTTPLTSSLTNNGDKTMPAQVTKQTTQVTVPVAKSNTIVNPVVSNGLNVISMIGIALSTIGIDPHSILTTLTSGNFWGGLAVSIVGQIIHHVVVSGSNNATIDALASAIDPVINGPTTTPSA